MGCGAAVVFICTGEAGVPGQGCHLPGSAFCREASGPCHGQEALRFLCA